MQVISVNPHPLSNTAFYAIGLTIDVNYQSPDEVPLSVQGWLRAHDGKVLGPIQVALPPQRGALGFKLSARDIVEPQSSTSESDSG